MNLSINKKGRIAKGIEDRLVDLLEFMKQNESNNKYATEEISPYDYSVLKGEIEDLLEQLGEENE